MATEKSPSKSLTVDRGGYFQAGGLQGPGRGPTKGNGGRPPDDFYEWLSGVFNSPKVRARLERLFREGDDAHLIKAAIWAAERLHGKPAQPIEATGTLTVVWRSE